MKPQTTSEALDNLYDKVREFVKPAKNFFLWFIGLFEKKVKYPIITHKNVVISDDEEFLKEHRKRQELSAGYFRRLSRYQGQKKFVKTGRNDKH